MILMRKKDSASRYVSLLIRKQKSDCLYRQQSLYSTWVFHRSWDDCAVTMRKKDGKCSNGNLNYVFNGFVTCGWMIFSWDGLCLWISEHDILIHDGKSNIELGSNDMARSVTNHFEHMESQKYTLILLIHCSTEPSFLLFKIIWYYLWHHRKEKGEIWNP